MASADTLIDTCCLVNLCAVDEPERILPRIPVTWYLARSVEREEISLRPRPDAARSERRRIDLAPCISSGILRRCQPESEQERDLYVSLTLEVDDGEAMPLAIAHVRKWRIATDDAAAVAVARRLGVGTMSTPELLRLWADHTSATKQHISQAIQRIESLARFVPSTALTAADWWDKHR